MTLQAAYRLLAKGDKQAQGKQHYEGHHGHLRNGQAQKAELDLGAVAVTLEQKIECFHEGEILVNVAQAGSAGRHLVFREVLQPDLTAGKIGAKRKVIQAPRCQRKYRSR